MNKIGEVNYLPLEVLNGYKEALIEIENYLRGFLSEVDDNLYRLSTRIKSYDSVCRKLNKKNTSLNTSNIVNNIHDIAGIRVVFGQFSDDVSLEQFDSIAKHWDLCELADNMLKLKKNDYNSQDDMTYGLIYIIKDNNNYKIYKERDYISNPKESGYSSYHIILTASNGFCVEVQIRNLCQHVWSVCEHHNVYKNVSPSDENIVGFQQYAVSTNTPSFDKRLIYK